MPVQPKIAAEPNLHDTVASFLVLPKVQFPDRTIAAQQAPAIHDALVAAAQAAQDAANALAIQQTQLAPPLVYVAPVLPTNDYKIFIYNMESGNNPGAINPSSGACGLGQALPCSKMPCSLSDYGCQDNFFTQYMLGRYGSWAVAYNWWLANSWW